MATIVDEEKKLLERIEQNPAVQGGRAVIKGTRVPVYVVVGALSDGYDVDHVCSQYLVKPTDVYAALLYAAVVLQKQRKRAVPSRREHTD